jgi:hypothetical protein
MCVASVHAALRIVILQPTEKICQKLFFLLAAEAEADNVGKIMLYKMSDLHAMICLMDLPGLLSRTSKQLNILEKSGAIFRGSCTCNIPTEGGYKAAEAAFQKLENEEISVADIMEGVR